MTKQEIFSRPELRKADDTVIEDAIAHAEPMVLRGLVYQLTGDPAVATTRVKTVLAGYFDVAAPATEADVALSPGRRRRCFESALCGCMNRGGDSRWRRRNLATSGWVGGARRAGSMRVTAMARMARHRYRQTSASTVSASSSNPRLGS